MQDLIDRFQQETVPLLCKLWPERFYEESGQLFAYYPDRSDVSVRCNSLDSLAAIAEACGVHTMAGFYSESGVVKWVWRYITDFGITLGVCPVDVSFPDELSARLAATIAAVAAVGSRVVVTTESIESGAMPWRLQIAASIATRMYSFGDAAAHDYEQVAVQFLQAADYIIAAHKATEVK